ncbi:sugar phosphate isomerase/epimerase [Stakelama sp. CBK3Z-3]|uniref:Sugar phosphate isomerase/epimerase n=1 Tax=Stakelama flava TaxID=2860338 RepID=A0ABS6XKQ3_9SPHN|nr:sugar phosphate isomerase/epimerase [Stakelama flava]MBW4330788.1 sugar phosphate isomerase/epimerase [Stakelama flava]
MKLGVSLYSYQQSQFFRELTLEDQIREVGEHLPYADGIEIVDEMSLRYPDPGEDFVSRWFMWMERYGTVPVTMDVSFDVLQFRDHVMSYDEVTERLERDLRLAKRLGFSNVRVLSTCPIEVLIAALPLAEELDLRLGKEVHQPMRLEGRQVGEIVEYVERSGTHHLGIVPDFGIFGFRPSEVLLAQYERRGASREASAASVELSAMLQAGTAPFALDDVSNQTAGNLRVAWKNFVSRGGCEAGLAKPFAALKAFAESRVIEPTEIDYVVVAEAIMQSNTSLETMRELAKHVISCHGKFNNMSPVPNSPGEFHDLAIDTAGAIAALREGGFEGYVNTEYEGQRYSQDRTRAEMMDEVEQVRRHQAMLRRLIGVTADAGAQ